MRRRAFGIIGMVLLLAWRSAATCHDAHLAWRQDATLGALIAASLCSTAASPATMPLRTPLPADPPDTDDPSPTGLGSAGVSCLHCASGGCRATAGRLTGGGWIGTLIAVSGVGPFHMGGKSGASAWRSGHPVRGPPQSGV